MLFALFAKKSVALNRRRLQAFLPTLLIVLPGVLQFSSERAAAKTNKGTLSNNQDPRPDEWQIVAPGVSCRQQIEHGTGTQAKHPVEVIVEHLQTK